MSTKNFPIYILSNGSTDSFPNNTLTLFKNRFPISFETKKNKKYQIAVQSIGISQKYKNILSLDNEKKEYHMITFLRPKEKENVALPYSTDVKGIKFKALEHNSQFVQHVRKIQFNTKEIVSVQDIKKLFSEINTTYGENLATTNDYLDISSSDNSLVVKNTTDRTIFVCFHPSTLISFGIISAKDAEKLPNNIPIEQTYQKIQHIKNDTFNLYWKNIEKLYIQKENNLVLNYKPVTGIIEYEGTYYLAFKIKKKPETWLYGTRDITQKYIPGVIKVECENIEEQIFDNGYSRDIFCFSPILPKEENDDFFNYYYQEFKTREYINFDNTILENLEIKIVDENNRQLELYSDVTTLIHLTIREMDDYDTHINLRLSSKPRIGSESNKPYKFKIKLPQPIETDRSWKIALTSISYPSTFSTFPPNDKLKSIIIHPYRRIGSELVLSNEIKFELESDIIYTKDTLVKSVDYFLRKNEFGVFKKENSTYYEQDCYQMYFTTKDEYEEVIFYISKPLLIMLGYAGNLEWPIDYEWNRDSCLKLTSSAIKTYIGIDNHTYKSITFDRENFYPFHFVNPTIRKSLLTFHNQIIFHYPTTFNNINRAGLIKTFFVTPFKNEIQLDYFIPKYLMLYGDFVNPSLVGGNLLKILKIIPIKESITKYVLYEIENKEFLELQNNVLDQMEFELRGHDGNFINFVSLYDVLLNLELTNNPYNK
jgi:hypothetical protein